MTTRLEGTHRDRVDLLGCEVDALDMDGTLSRCMQLIESGGGPVRQVSMNAAKVVQCETDEDLVEFIRGSDLVNADGQALVWAARLFGRPLPERVAGIDLMEGLMCEGERRGLGIYVLGAREEVLDRALGRIRHLHPKLRIAGAMHGYFPTEETGEVIERIRSARPDMLFVALPSPMKEHWLSRHLEETGVPFGMGVGGSIDVLAGECRRAPRWMQRSGLEWLFRLGQDPQRMWRRYLVGNLRFAWIVGRELARGRSGASEVAA